MTKLDQQAAELGFTIKKGPTRFSGYVLKRLIKRAPETSKRKATAIDEIIDENEELQLDEYESQVDEYPLGSDFRASLSDIENYLEDLAADISAGRVKQSDDDDAEPEVETGAKVVKVKPPSRQTLAVALRSHSDRKEIKKLMKSAKVSDQSGGKTLQDLILEEKSYQSRKRYEAEQAWRTNIDSVRDPWHEQEYNEAFNLFRDGERDRREWLASIERENAAFIPPDPTGYDTPKPASGFQVTSKRRRKSI